jgi:hypothetical protein
VYLVGKSGFVVGPGIAGLVQINLAMAITLSGCSDLLSRAPGASASAHAADGSPEHDANRPHNLRGDAGGDGDSQERGDAGAPASDSGGDDLGPPKVRTGCPCTSQLCEGACNGHGTCRSNDLASGDATCICDPGYGGPDCFFQAGSCPGDCSGHGTCNPDTGQCTCDPGFFGDDCSAETWTACPEMCSGHGHCDLATGTCTCTAATVEDGGQPLYWGHACEIPGCLNNCTGRGQCVPAGCSSCNFRVCECEAGWTGADCAQPEPAQ